MANVDELRAVICKLPIKDQPFATSLATSVEKQRGKVSVKQQYWIDTLHARATEEKPAEKPKANVGDLSALNTMFDRAKQSIKNPAITFTTPDFAGGLKVKSAGATSRNPGSLYVTDIQSGNYLGKIGTDNAFTPVSGLTNLDAVVKALRDFAQSPAEIAASHGHRTNNCCFCSRALTNKSSVKVGYGPICAENFGLPWGGDDEDAHEDAPPKARRNYMVGATRANHMGE
jgi:hypothetical protein